MEWILDEREVMEFIRKGYKDFYSTTLPCSIRVMNSTGFWQTALSDSERDNLNLPVSEEEIKAALWSMKAYKALGPDGLHAGFFQRFWLVVGKFIINEIKESLPKGGCWTT